MKFLGREVGLGKHLECVASIFFQPETLDTSLQIREGS
jgi:hypothetical protein